jgi:NADH-ubiquinone oxidoreductase chain 2
VPSLVGGHYVEGWCYRDISFISEFKGLFFSNPLLSISLSLSLFSMAGIPPLIGFFSKQLVLYSALQNGYYFISVLAVIVSVISCSYYLQIIKILLTQSSNHHSFASPHSPHSAGVVGGHSYGVVGGAEPLWRAGALAQGVGPNPNPASPASPNAGGEGKKFQRNGIILTNTHSYLISTLTFTILLFFIKPSLILNSTQLLSLSLFYI